MFGYMGRILKVDLSTGKMEDYELEQGILRDYLGGRGIGIKLLLDENPIGVDPLSSENRLIFMTGPYTGTIGPFSAFYNVTTKSPLTGTALSSHSGGIWGPYLKESGYDGILIKGKSEEPVYLVIDDDTIVGLITLADCNKITQAQWDHTSLSEVMTPVDRLQPE
jgi:aldehyde:ferredoxin oxidoreductase